MDKALEWLTLGEASTGPVMISHHLTQESLLEVNVLLKHHCTYLGPGLHSKIVVIGGKLKDIDSSVDSSMSHTIELLPFEAIREA